MTGRLGGWQPDARARPAPAAAGGALAAPAVTVFGRTGQPPAGGPAAVPGVLAVLVPAAWRAERARRCGCWG